MTREEFLAAASATNADDASEGIGADGLPIQPTQISQTDAQGRSRYGTVGAPFMPDPDTASAGIGADGLPVGTISGFATIDGQRYSRGATWEEMQNQARAGGLDWSAVQDPTIYDPEQGILIPDRYQNELNAISERENDDGGFMSFATLLLSTVGIPMLMGAFAAGGIWSGVEGAVGSSFPAAAEGFSWAGEGLIGSGATSAAGAVGEVAGQVAETLPALTEADQFLIDSVQEWMTETGVVQDAALEGSMFDVPSASTAPGNTVTPSANEPNLPSRPEQFLNQPAPTNTGTQAPAPVSEIAPSMIPGRGAASSGVIDSLINWGQQNPRLASSLVTGALQVAGGMGTAAANRDTMEQRARLELEGTFGLRDDAERRRNANAYTGTLGFRPAANLQPLQRLSGGPVYGPTGLINSIRR